MKEQTDNTIQCRASNGITLSASQPWQTGEPVRFIYAPAGVHSITAGFRGNDTISICLEIDEQTATDLQNSFNRLTASTKQEPYGDEDHEGRKATLRFPKDVTQFSWGNINGEAGVIVCAVPTNYGAEAVNGKTYRSFSPEFAADADYEHASCLHCKESANACQCDKGHFTFGDGIRGSMTNPARIVAVNFVAGALTNKPAFHAMPPVKAKKAEEPGDVIRAAGTSEGVKKSWEKRHDEHFNAALEAGGAAQDLGRYANSLSPGAHKTESHHKAADAHINAAKVHEKAAAFFKSEGFEKQHKFHQMLAGQHSELAKFHRDLVSSCDATESDSIQASEPQSDTRAAFHAEHYAKHQGSTGKGEMLAATAHSLSQRAFTTGTREDHKAAQQAHLAALEALGTVEAGKHLEYAQEHAQFISGTDRTESDTIQAAGTSEGVRKSWEKRHRYFSGFDGEEHHVAFGPNDSKEERKAFKKASDALADATRGKYFTGVPVTDFGKILDEHGFSGKALEGIYTGREGRATAQVGPNTFHHMTWYKMPESGRYEAVSYMSHGKSLEGHWQHKGELPSNPTKEQESMKASEPRTVDSILASKQSTAKTMDETISATWSEEARRASAESRRANAGKAVEFPHDIGDGYYVHKVGVDTNGNHSVWVSKGSNKAKKIQTGGGNAPKAHRLSHKPTHDEFTDEVKSELRSYHEKFLQGSDASELVANIISAAGTSEGVRKGWEKRKLHPSQIAVAEAMAHHSLAKSRADAEVAKLQKPHEDAPDSEWLEHYEREEKIRNEHGENQARDRVRKAEDELLANAKAHIERQPVYQNASESQKADLATVWAKGPKSVKFRPKLVDTAMRLDFTEGVKASSPLQSIVNGIKAAGEILARKGKQVNPQPENR